MEGLFRGTLTESGRIKYKNPDDFEGFCNQFQDTEVLVHIKPIVSNASKLNLYAYYQSVIIPFCVKTLTDEGFDGADDDLADTYLKSECAKGIRINKRTDMQMTFLMEKKRMTKESL